MIIDARNEFCDAIALNTGGAGTYLLGSQIDTGAAGSLASANNDHLYLVITVDTLPTSANSTATATFTLASDASAAVATDGSASVHLVTKAFSISEMAAGTVLYCGKLPYSAAEPYEQYLGILQTTGTQAFTAGKINAFLTADPAAWAATPDAL